MQQYIGHAHATQDTRYSKSSYGQKIAFLTTSNTGFQYAGSTKSGYVMVGIKGYEASYTNYVGILDGKGVIADKNGKKYACEYNNGELVWLAEKEKYDARPTCYGVKKFFCMEPNDTADKVRVSDDYVGKYNGKNWSMQNFHDAIATIAPKNTTIQAENSNIKKVIPLQNEPLLQESHNKCDWKKFFANGERKKINDGINEAKRDEKAVGKERDGKAVGKVNSLEPNTMSQLNKLENKVHKSLKPNTMSGLNKLDNKVYNSLESKTMLQLNAKRVNSGFQI